jgi:hypothetical protein
MSRIRIACNHGTVRTDNVERAIPASPDWLSFVKFNHLAIIDILRRKRAQSLRHKPQAHPMTVEPGSPVVRERSVMNAVAVGRSRFPTRYAGTIFVSGSSATTSSQSTVASRYVMLTLLLLATGLHVGFRNSASLVWSTKRRGFKRFEIGWPYKKF